MTMLVVLLFLLGSPAFVLLGAPYLARVYRYSRAKASEYEVEFTVHGPRVYRKVRKEENDSELS